MLENRSYCSYCSRSRAYLLELLQKERQQLYFQENI